MTSERSEPSINTVAAEGNATRSGATLRSSVAIGEGPTKEGRS
jgi:hypothetical protein